MTKITENLSLEKVVREWQTPIYHLALSYLGDESDAADATQDIFIAVLRDLGSLDDQQRFRAWLFTLSRRMLSKRKAHIKRRESRKRSLPNASLLSENKQDKDIDKHLVKNAVSDLPDLYRQVIELSYFLGFTQHEIGEMLDRSRTTVQAQLNKGLDLLRRKLQTSMGLAIVPSLENTLSTITSPGVPKTLTSALLKLESSSRIAGFLTTAMTGGTIVKGTLLTGCVAALVIGLLGGDLAGSALENSEETHSDSARPRPRKRNPTRIALLPDLPPATLSPKPTVTSIQDGSDSSRSEPALVEKGGLSQQFPIEHGPYPSEVKFEVVFAKVLRLLGRRAELIRNKEPTTLLDLKLCPDIERCLHSSNRTLAGMLTLLEKDLDTQLPAIRQYVALMKACGPTGAFGQRFNSVLLRILEKKTVNSKLKIFLVGQVHFPKNPSQRSKLRRKLATVHSHLRRNDRSKIFIRSFELLMAPRPQGQRIAMADLKRIRYARRSDFPFTKRSVLWTLIYRALNYEDGRFDGPALIVSARMCPNRDYGDFLCRFLLKRSRGSGALTKAMLRHCNEDCLRTLRGYSENNYLTQSERNFSTRMVKLLAVKFDPKKDKTE